jgi:CheY-like chemotaxis protein
MTDPDLAEPVAILLVGDDEDGLRSALEALRDSRIPSHVTIARDGGRALDLLRRSEPHVAARPDLILLDADLPGKGGLEVLAELKGDPRLAAIPVVVLASAEGALSPPPLGADGQIPKPMTLDAFIPVIQPIEAARRSMPGGLERS